MCVFWWLNNKKFVGPFENQYSLIFSSAACMYLISIRTFENE